jgi:HSP20 family molecular chaperone IbpA
MNVVLRKNNNLFDNWFDDMFTEEKKHYMRSDVKELDNEYEFKIDMPGYKKENIKISLNEGYLTIEADNAVEKKEEKNEKFLHKERFYGHVCRTFYVGEDINEEGITAKFEDGVLVLVVPKKEHEEPAKKYIEIA